MAANDTALWPGSVGPTTLPDPSEYDGDSAVVVAALTITLSSIFVGLRFWSRAFILRNVALEDWLILTALVCAVLESGTVLFQLRHGGLGRHFFFVDPTTLEVYLKSSVFSGIIYALGLTFTKLSILCLYIRVLIYDYVRPAAKIVLVIVIISHLWIIIALCTICVPIDAFWDLSKRPTAYCHPMDVFWSHAGINIVTDFMIFLLPITVLHKLRIGKGQKVALYFVFLIAFGVCVISIVRCVDLARAATNPDPDLTWRAVSTANWTMIEVHAAVICACLTTLKPLIGRVFPRLLASYRPSDGEVQGPSDRLERERRLQRAQRGRSLEMDTVDSHKSTLDSSAEPSGSGRVDEAGNKEIGPVEVKTEADISTVTPTPVKDKRSYDSLGRGATASRSIV